MSGRIRKTTAAAAAAAALMVALAGCSAASTSEGPGSDVPYVAPSVNASAANKELEGAEADAEATTEAQPDQDVALNAGPEAVRDAFAGLQATYHDGCTPGSSSCVYFLGRVHTELTGLDKSMRAEGADGLSHFKEPLAWMSALRTTLDSDASTANLEKHRKQLLGTRDRINAWMQGHPEDYR